jgi:hypothetical protein
LIALLLHDQDVKEETFPLKPGIRFGALGRSTTYIEEDQRSIHLSSTAAWDCIPSGSWAELLLKLEILLRKPQEFFYHPPLVQESE